jgi:hypothetical protein
LAYQRSKFSGFAMQIYFPQNIFTDLIKNALPEKLSTTIKSQPSSLITSEILKDPNSIGLIPTLDLIRHNDLFVSKKFGISFEESLCNSYLYYSSERKNFEDLYIIGDISSNEAVGAKLILKELYGIELKINLLTDPTKSSGKNILLVGDVNFENDNYLNGISFAEEITEVLSLPYVNFVLASVNQKPIEDFHKYVGTVQMNIYNNIENDDFGANLSNNSRKMFKENISSFICNLDKQDIDGINQLLRLPFFHEIISDIIDLKYV